MLPINIEHAHAMYNDKSHSKYFAPYSEVVYAITESLFAASDTETYDGNATLEDFEVFDLCE